MEYRNRPLYLFSLVAIAPQPAVAAYFVFLDSGLSGATSGSLFWLSPSRRL